MNPELEKQLVKDYPVLFKFHGGDPKETCMAWGCEHGDGWFDLLKNLCDYVNAICRHKLMVKYKDDYVKTEEEKESKYTHIQGPSIEFTQIKEKFAGLRIYYSMHHDITEEQVAKLDEKSYDKEYNKVLDEISHAVSYTEFLSCRTCEVCGAKGRVYRDGWWKTLCPKCAVDQKRDDSHIGELL
jgi:rubrerythrin